MTIQEFIKKWNVGYEDSEQELEFALEMANDLRIITKQALSQHDVMKSVCQCEELSNINDSILGINTCIKCDKPIDRQTVL